jgi:hypothetical protein
MRTLVCLWYEETTIRSFIVRRKRERYLAFVRDPGLRTKLTHQLAHFKDIDPKYKRVVPASKRSAWGIGRVLAGMGAPALCYVISEHPRLDRIEMPLEEALETFIGSGMGAILSCIPGRLAFIQTEDEGFILERKRPWRRRKPCVRFQTRLIDGDSRVEEGIFMAAYRLSREGDFSAHEKEELLDLLEWFGENLHAPDVLEKEYNKTAISWFKTEATECITRIWSMVRLLEEHGVVIDKITTRHPGWVIYDDKWQVVAHPPGTFR